MAQKKNASRETLFFNGQASKQPLSQMNPIDAAVLQALEAIMTIADDLRVSENFAVILHNGPLLFRAMRFKFAGNIPGIVCGCQSRIAGRLRPIKRIAAKIRLFPGLRRLCPPHMHLIENAADGVLLGRAPAGAPAILQHRLSAMKIREIKIRIGRNGFPN